MNGRFHQDIFVGIVTTLLACFVLYKTTSISGGAEIMPMGVGILILILGICIIIGGIKKTKMSGNNDSQFEGEEERINLELIKIPLMLLVIITVYIALLGIIGFFLATALFILVSLIFFGVKKWSHYILTIIGVNLFIYLVFVMLLNVRLPAGIF